MIVSFHSLSDDVFISTLSFDTERCQLYIIASILQDILDLCKMSEMTFLDSTSVYIIFVLFPMAWIYIFFDYAYKF